MSMVTIPSQINYMEGIICIFHILRKSWSGLSIEKAMQPRTQVFYQDL